MIILTIRTDNPEAEVGLFDGHKELKYEKWVAHRKLAETLHHQIAKVLQFVGKDWEDIEGIIAYKGPGSFTGLRIGLTVANTLAGGLHMPIVGMTDDTWVEKGITKLIDGENDTLVVPEYGGEVFTTTPRK